MYSGEYDILMLTGHSRSQVQFSPWPGFQPAWHGHLEYHQCVIFILAKNLLEGSSLWSVYQTKTVHTLNTTSMPKADEKFKKMPIEFNIVFETCIVTTRQGRSYGGAPPKCSVHRHNKQQQFFRGKRYLNTQYRK